ncbi:MAG: DinB family protein [Acidobacteriota bacterium]
MRDTVIQQLETTMWAVRQNLADLRHEESLQLPAGGGSCANWVLGHLLHTGDSLLQVLGGERVTSREAMAPYHRGAGPLTAEDARPLAELLADLERSHQRIIARLQEISPEELAAPSPISPRRDVSETVGSFAVLLAFHQAYHAGQLGILRRLAGHPGAMG